MNSKQAKEYVSIVGILNQLGVPVAKENSFEAWYLSPFRKEKTPSFKVDKNRNIYYDFGIGEGGNVIDFVMTYYKVDFKEALQLMEEKLNCFSFHQPSSVKRRFTAKRRRVYKTYKITSEGNIRHPALVSYIKQKRKLSLRMAQKYCREIHYRYANNENEYFSIGFKNDLGGFELRNSRDKRCFGKKAITTIRHKKEALMIFEGWADFIAFLTLYPSREEAYDFMILNSLSLINGLLKDQQGDLHAYTSITTCLDNDDAGEAATKMLLNVFGDKILDARYHYTGYKDFNDFLIGLNKK